MSHSQMFFIFAVASIAPHVPEGDAKLVSIGCAAVAVVLAIIEWKLKP